MFDVFYHPVFASLAQMIPPTPPGWDDADPTPPPPVKQAPMTLQDFQQGMRNWRSEEPNNSLRNWLLVGVAGLALLVLAVQLQQRWQNRKKGAVDSERALFKELTRGMKLPLGSGLLLWWLGHSSKVSKAALIISPELFRQAVEKWSHLPTFSLARRMMLGRVARLEEIFGS